MDDKKEIKDNLRKGNRFHRVDPNILNGIDEYAEWLEAVLHNGCSIGENSDGEEVLIDIRKALDRFDGLKIEIYPNEHPPPHFHVKSPNINASFKIKDCDKIDGTIDFKDYKKIKHWHKKSKELLIEAWNESRPTDCVVGNYKE